MEKSIGFIEIRNIGGIIRILMYALRQTNKYTRVTTAHYQWN